MPKHECNVGGLRPGHLLAPFGWAGMLVGELAQLESDFLAHLFELDQKRMHLIALVLAHVDQRPSRPMAQKLVRGRARDVLAYTLADVPHGLVRALGKLPDEVLSREGYRCLVDLLHESNAAKLIRHAPAIYEDDLFDVAALPARLRRNAIVDAFGWMDGAREFACALRLLVDRGVVADEERVIDQLASARNAAEVRVQVRKLVEALPLPSALPPSELGAAVRIDRISELRDLANRWQNCLATYTGKVDAGEAAIYLWDEPDLQAACLLKRHGRLGWFLSDVKGPGNGEIDEEAVKRIQMTFSDAGVPPKSIAEAIKSLCMTDDARVREQQRFGR